jgi:hypothetical protein
MRRRKEPPWLPRAVALEHRLLQCFSDCADLMNTLPELSESPPDGTHRVALYRSASEALAPLAGEADELINYLRRTLKAKEMTIATLFVGGFKRQVQSLDMLLVASWALAAGSGAIEFELLTEVVTHATSVFLADAVVMGRANEVGLTELQPLVQPQTDEFEVLLAMQPRLKEVEAGIVARDWGDTARSLAIEYGGEVDSPVWWAVADILPEDSRALAVLTPQALFAFPYDPLRDGIEGPTLPPIITPMALVADWEVREPNRRGNIVVRLLEVDEDALGAESLSSLLETDSDKGVIVAIGVRAGEGRSAFLEAVVEQVKASGAFDPAHRDFHPLQD